ncbi:hypothetical protein J7L36_01955 [bacterium]|nr:hypothetical protein [bacterium]
MRLVFKEKEEFQKWIMDQVGLSPSPKYECYITPGDEVVLVPKKSTRPLKYGYAKLTPEAVEAIKKEVEKLGIKVYRCDVEWAEDRPIGIKFTPE